LQWKKEGSLLPTERGARGTLIFVIVLIIEIGNDKKFGQLACELNDVHTYVHRDAAESLCKTVKEKKELAPGLYRRKTCTPLYPSPPAPVGNNYPVHPSSFISRRRPPPPAAIIAPPHHMVFISYLVTLKRV
jgi:hypothetical protein